MKLEFRVKYTTGYKFYFANMTNKNRTKKVMSNFSETCDIKIPTKYMDANVFYLTHKKLTNLTFPIQQAVFGVFGK